MAGRRCFRGWLSKRSTTNIQVQGQLEKVCKPCISFWTDLLKEAPITLEAIQSATFPKIMTDTGSKLTARIMDVCWFVFVRRDVKAIVTVNDSSLDLFAVCLAPLIQQIASSLKQAMVNITGDFVQQKLVVKDTCLI